jgi:glycosyltransferase involved in cell wall biosynthesis
MGLAHARDNALQAARTAVGNHARTDAGSCQGEDPVALRFREVFPERYPPLTAEDYEGYVPSIEGWRALLEEYDVIQGYAVEPFIPLLAGKTNFTAYEHGTLRTIPFEDTPRGRICALCYREAPIVFITNSDVLEPARRLGLTDEQMVFLPHAVDSAKLLRFAAAHSGLAPDAEAPITFFSPTRHDWVSGDPNWNKGNDRMLHALRDARDRGFDCRLSLIAWGTDLNASQELIQQLDLTEHVEWHPPMKKRELWSRYLQAHAVIDQFITPAIGGVTFEAMALGRRVITALDIETTEHFFGAAPPVLIAATPAEITEALCTVAADPLDLAKRGQTASDWFARYHSAERIVQLQLEGYAQLLHTN